MSKAVRTSAPWTYDESGNKVAYEVDNRLFDVPLKIYYSDNAWWMDRMKVEAMIEAFTRRYTITEMCVFARISLNQWHYFAQQHPHFSEAKTRLQSVGPMTWKGTIMKAARTDWKAAITLLERVQPEEYAPSRGSGNELPRSEGESVLDAVERGMFDESGALILNEKMRQYLENKK